MGCLHRRQEFVRRDVGNLRLFAEAVFLPQLPAQPDGQNAGYLAAGKAETLLEAFAPPELGIYAVLPSNRYMPQGVRVLIDFLSDRLASAAATARECS